jgi:hypothetical protein
MTHGGCPARPGFAFNAGRGEQCFRDRSARSDLRATIDRSAEQLARVARTTRKRSAREARNDRGSAPRTSSIGESEEPARLPIPGR